MDTKVLQWCQFVLAVCSVKEIKHLFDGGKREAHTWFADNIACTRALEHYTFINHKIIAVKLMSVILYTREL